MFLSKIYKKIEVVKKIIKNRGKILPWQQMKNYFHGLVFHQ